MGSLALREKWAAQPEVPECERPTCWVNIVKNTKSVNCTCNCMHCLIILTPFVIEQRLSFSLFFIIIMITQPSPKLWHL